MSGQGGYFNPRSPHGERRVRQCTQLSLRYFNPRSPHGERRCTESRRRAWQYFNPRSPHGERQFRHIQRHIIAIFQSTLPARGATLVLPVLPCDFCISIHAPRTGSDALPVSPAQSTRLFQSTLPARGATPLGGRRSRAIADFNPRSPHGERRAKNRRRENNQEISIHAPRTGSDATALVCNSRLDNFNPRSPHGERHDFRHPPERAEAISIHAPRTGSDRNAVPQLFRLRRISIHAPRTGSDNAPHCKRNGKADFNPRSPHGERHWDDINKAYSEYISIHAPRTGSDFPQRRCRFSA